YVCFFFSSRRRHTRSKRDWSSDVCSSDLSTRPTRPSQLESALRWRLQLPFIGPKKGIRVHCGGSNGCSTAHSTKITERLINKSRSEERRVGKECKSRWVVNQ